MELVHQGAWVRGHCRVPVHGARVAGLEALGRLGGRSRQSGEVPDDVRWNHADKMDPGGSSVVNIFFLKWVGGIIFVGE